MSRIEEQRKEERLRRPTVVAGWVIILSLISIAFNDGLKGIGVPGVDILQRIAIAAVCTLAVIVIARLLLYLSKFIEARNSADELEYLLWLISQGKEYSQIEEYLIDLDGLERKRREAREWIANEGPEHFHKERVNRWTRYPR